MRINDNFVFLGVVLGLCSGALAKVPPEYIDFLKEKPSEKKQIVCNDESKLKEFDRYYLIGREDDYKHIGYLECHFSISRMSAYCTSSIYTPDYIQKDASKKIADEILSEPLKHFSKHYDQIFESGACKILDENLNDITHKRTRPKAEAE